MSKGDPHALTTAMAASESMLEYDALRRRARHCEHCELYRYATQTVFGEGTIPANLMLVGEQPGDKEDLAGHPFVGPAGNLLRAVLAESASAQTVYITNAVKHFNYIERGKRRIHAKPKIIHIESCEPWLESEVEIVKPKLLVALGATAARALVGRAVAVRECRGSILESRFRLPVLVTIHPSAILRSLDPETRARDRRQFTRDIQHAGGRSSAIHLMNTGKLGYR